VHPASHIDFIADLSARGGGAIDMDTSAVAGTYEAALRSAGGAVALVDALVRDGEPCGMSALRPPGHHAEKARAMGFCFFNNVAVGAAHARAAHGLERVAILDWDVHHGNGTNDIFHADPSVLFCSIHEWPLYPGTGPATDMGSGAGEGSTVNLPVPGGSGDEVHGSLVEHVVAPLIRGWRPELVLVSAGFDAHRADPLATCTLSEAGFAGMTGSLRRACADVGAPIGLVLEGGYAAGALAASMAALVPVLVAAEPPEADELPVHPLAEGARERLARFWPAQFGTTRRM
jgi:acetoin utilization deacetylase AcuC-like enzyme